MGFWGFGAEIITTCISVHNQHIRHTSIIILHNIESPHTLVKSKPEDTTSTLIYALQNEIRQILSIEFSELNKKLILFTNNKDRPEILNRLQQLNTQFQNNTHNYHPFQFSQQLTKSDTSTSQHTRKSYLQALISSNKRTAQNAIRNVNSLLQKPKFTNNDEYNTSKTNQISQPTSITQDTTQTQLSSLPIEFSRFSQTIDDKLSKIFE